MSFYYISRLCLIVVIIIIILVYSFMKQTEIVVMSYRQCYKVLRNNERPTCVARYTFPYTVDNMYVYIDK